MGDEGKAVGIAQAPAALLSNRRESFIANSEWEFLAIRHPLFAVGAREPARQSRLILC
jgi:hypothetical protein